MLRVFALFTVMFTFVPTASAYIGPGVGAGAAAVVFGVIASVAIAFVAILWYPFKRLLKRRRRKEAGAGQRADDTAEDMG